jgi:DNA-binding CsgD family transcriptional regulator
MAAGSAVGMTYAVRHPERVSRLVLYASYIRNKLAGNPKPQQVEEAQARLKMMELGWPNDTPAYGQFYGLLHMPDASAEQSQSFADLFRRTTSSANAVALLRTFFAIDLQEIVPKIRCPTLVLHCRADSIIRFEEGRSVAAFIPGARFVPLESRNHVLLDTEPAWQQFVEALDDFLPVPAQPAGTENPLFDELTEREHQVLEVVAQGFDNATIGEHLHISERTARNHVSAILAKLGINTRAQAIVRAREAGFGQKKIR